MSEDFSLYEFSRNLSLVGWAVVFAVMIAVIYVIAKGTELLVIKKWPFCENAFRSDRPYAPFAKRPSASN